MCDEAGVTLLYLPPYSPDLNPIEETFAQIKRYIRRNQALARQNNGALWPGFLMFVATQALVGTDMKGYFRNAGVIFPDE